MPLACCSFKDAPLTLECWNGANQVVGTDNTLFAKYRTATTVWPSGMQGCTLVKIVAEDTYFYFDDILVDNIRQGV